MNTANTCNEDQPYIHAFQAGQFYYVPGIKLEGAWKVVKNRPMDNYDFLEVSEKEELNVNDESYQQNETDVVNEQLEVDGCDIYLRRFYVPTMKFDASVHQHTRSNHKDDDGFINDDTLVEDDIISEDSPEEYIISSQDDDMFA